jgi:hypothetical protein
MKLLIEYSEQMGIKEYKIIASNDHEANHLMGLQDKIIEILGPSTIVEEIKEGLDRDNEQDDTARTKDLFDTGGC